MGSILPLGVLAGLDTKVQDGVLRLLGWVRV